MKIALCLSGLMRDYSLLRGNISRCLIKANKCDIFVSTWDVTGSYCFPKSDGKVKSHNLDYKTKLFNCPLIREDVARAYRPNLKGLEVEDFYATNKKFQEIDIATDSKRRYFTRGIFGRILSQHYKIKKCNELRKKYEREKKISYDIIIRCRPDLLFRRPFKIESIPDSLLVTAYSNLPVKIEDGGSRSLNDQFAVARPEHMDVYCSLYDHLIRYVTDLPIEKLRDFTGHPLKEHRHLGIELFIHYHLWKYNIRVKKSDDIRFRIVRDSFTSKNTKARLGYRFNEAIRSLSDLTRPVRHRLGIKRAR